MFPSMAKPNGKKRTNGNGRKRASKNGRDWAKIKKRYAESTLNFTDFITKESIPKSTAIGHSLHKVAKINIDQLRDAAIDSREKFRERLNVILSDNADGDDNVHREHLRSLRAASHVANQVVDLAGGEFVKLSSFGGQYNSTGEAARTALRGAQSLIDISNEIAGMPAPDEVIEFPMTRGFRPHPYQRDFIFDLPSTLRREMDRRNDKHTTPRIFTFIAGIGAGKTFCGAHKFGELCAINRGGQSAIYAPTYRMLDDITKQTFLDVLRMKGIPYLYKASKEECVLWGDTLVMFRSLDNDDHLRGPTLTHAWLDEAGQIKKRKPFDVVQGRVRDPNAIELLTMITTTPDGMNWLYDICTEDADELGVKMYHGSTHDNVTLLDSYYKGLKRLYDPKFAKQELEGTFINVFAGQAYWNFERRYNAIPKAKCPVSYDPERELILTCDFNVSPMCWNVIQQFDRLDFGLEEIHLDTASTQLAIDEFILRYPKHRAPIHIYGDANHGNARQTSASYTDFQIIETTLRKKYRSNTLEIRLQPNPRVTDRIAAVNARFKSVDNKRHMFFIKETNKQTIADFEKVCFLEGTRQIDKTTDKKLTHHSDAIGYYVELEYPLHGIRVTQGRR